MDRRCIEILREDGTATRLNVPLPAEAEMLLLVRLELPADTTAERAYEEIAAAPGAGAPDTSLVRFCRLIERAGALEMTEIAVPGDSRRMEQLIALREAVPAGVNQRVGQAQRSVDGRIAKTAADMVVPFGHFAEMNAIYRYGFEARGLDYAIWGHISDGNVHPNVIPRSFEDVEKGQEAILEFGRNAARLGGSPLAEHGVGRNPVKQALLRQLYGEAGIEQMRAVKRALDPEFKLAPGVIFTRG
jgi:D-lactate dehydrogenase (cytochrome)